MKIYSNFILERALFFVPFIFILACTTPTEESRFTEMAKASGIPFANNLEYTEEFNPYTYRSFFNGGGVAIGDINNDGLMDIYFTGNLVDNQLYLNKGNWQFEDITVKAGVACPGVWSSGATFADVNGDGLLDLYVCKSGKPGGDNRYNELFINNGDLTFTEKSKEFGLDITGLSTHAAFFDYDKDGDLDCYVLTNSLKSIGGFDLVKGQREIPDENGGGNKLLRNDNGVYVDVTLESGIYASAIGFGLGITLSDFNNDGWTDLFISNDFFERDYLYINQKGERFKESLEQYFNSISMGSMGADAADLDNDSEPDLFVTEMLPSNVQRKRTKAVYENWDKYQLNVRQGYFHQYPRNVLQQKINDSLFVEVGRYSDVSATDWSWGALIFDANNDGLRDIFVANGIYKDLLDRDYLTYTANDQQIRNHLKEKGNVIKDLIDAMPSQAVPNQMFENKGQFNFANVSSDWGLGEPSFSNGSAYGDLDNDGDLDLVINNVNMPAFVYRNNIDTATNRSVRISLQGERNNRFGIGASVKLFQNGQMLSAENYPFKGFQSTVEPIIHFGVGDAQAVDSLVVIWESGKINTITSVPTNQTIRVSEATGQEMATDRNLPSSYLKASSYQIDFAHIENDHNDFDRDRLLPHMLHNEGPGMAAGDLDGDGLDEIFIGGAKGQKSALFTFINGEYVSVQSPVLAIDSLSEDTDAVFFDCDNDGDLDLYVASGGRAFSQSSSALNDRLYLNQGSLSFTKSTDLPIPKYFSTSSVSVLDYDSDGDLDLLVTERFHPFRYGDKVDAFLYENNGKGVFTDVSAKRIPALQGVNMITDSDVGDIDGDGDVDIIIASDWDDIRVFINKEGTFEEQTGAYGLSDRSGWWKVVKLVDIDQDGDLDALAGNHGLNSFFRDTTRLYVNDFDGNGTYDYIFCEKIDGKYYPVADKNDLISQLPILKKKLLYFKDYASMTVTDIFTDEQLNSSIVLDATEKASTILINEQGKFTLRQMPGPLQYGPIYSIKKADLDDDPYPEFVVGGNQFLVKPQFGRYDALPLLVMDGLELHPKVHLTNIVNQVRGITTVALNGKQLIIVANNDSKVQIYEKK